MERRAAFIYDDVLSQHVLSESHPMKPVRLRYTYELLDAYGAFKASNVLLSKPRAATEQELMQFHTRDYIDAVRGYSIGKPPFDPGQYNLGTGDNPYYLGMYEAAAFSTGASVKAAELLVSGEVTCAMNISGGLHHAMPGYAAGFCVFNDPVIAIKSLLAFGMRVAYVDIDCHHGDGVQHAFYDTDKVLTVSLHESGTFLFPGTGWPQEIGTGKGRGYSVNVPLYPYTTDDLYYWVFKEVVLPLLEAFAPDVVVTQLGMDTHFRDPITHLGLTIQGFKRVVSHFPSVAPYWLALGGGGYDVQATARGWTVAFGVMSGQEFPDEIPESFRKRYDIPRLYDHEELTVSDSVQEDAKIFAERNVQIIKRLVFPIHGLYPI